MTTETSIYEYAKQGLQYGSERTAIWFYGKSISYGELFEKIDNVADHLYALGVREGTVVTIHLPNCPQAVMAIYAVAKLGGICNMVHPLTPEAALRENMAFTESEYLITHLPIDCGRTITIEQFAALEQYFGERAEGPETAHLGWKCAFYIHSSGTMGKPKTVMISHYAINTWLENVRSCFPINDKLYEQRCLSVAPFSHCMGLTADLLRAVSCGAALYIMPRWSVPEAVSIIQQHRITFMTGVPAMYGGLLQYDGFDGDAASSLIYCVIGGDAVPGKMVQKLDERIGRRACFSEYGLTEATSAVCLCTPEHDKKGASGYPVRGTKIAVLSPLNEVEPSGRGELLIRSESLMLGYCGDPEATRLSFVEYNGEQWLRTGDYGFVDSEGYVFFMDRIKNIIIHNGYNIVPSEVEGCIKQVEGVQEAFVFETKSPDGHQPLLAAAVTPSTASDREALQREIETVCRGKLPAYALPKLFLFVDKLPRNSVGKVDRSALQNLL